MANISQINGLQINAVSASFATSASYVTGISTLSAVQVFRTSSYTLTTSFVNLTFTTASLQNASTTLSHSLSSRERIHIGEAGLYQITYNASAGVVPSQLTGGINDFEFRLFRNGTNTLSGSLVNGRNSSTDVGAASATVLAQLSANDYITLQARISGSTAQNPIVYESASLNVIKLDGITGPQGPAGTSGIGGVDGQIQYNNASSFGGVPTLTYVGGILRATGSFSGSLTGTSSYVTGSIFTSTNPALTASFATTASRAVTSSNALTASYSNTLGASLLAPTIGNIQLLNSFGTNISQLTNFIASSASFSSNTFTNLKTVRLEMGVSSTTAITTGAKGRKTVSFNGTIVGFRLVADQSTTTTLDIWKSNLAIPTVANTITAAAKPALTAAQLAGSTTLTGWTTSVADGDVFILNVDSNDNATYICLEIDIVLTNA